LAFREPLAAYNAATNLEAHMVCDLLLEAGIDAMVIEDVSQVGVAVTGMIAEIHKPQIWIERADAERAGPILAEYERKGAERRSGAGEAIYATCDECQKRSAFPGSMRGMVETCPHCGGYLDVEPDGGEPLPAGQSLGGKKPNAMPNSSSNPYSSPATGDEMDLSGGPILVFLKNVLTIHGRATRVQWWMFHAVLLVAFGLLHKLGENYENAVAFEMLFALFAIWPKIAMDIRRWHDLDKPGFFEMLMFIPWIGMFILILPLGFLRGTQGPNRYGLDPSE